MKEAIITDTPDILRIVRVILWVTIISINSMTYIKLSNSQKDTNCQNHSKRNWRGFPGGLVVENLPASAVVMVWSLVQEVPTCSGATKPCVPQLLSQCSRACEPQLLSPCAATTEAHCTYSPCSATREVTSMRSPRTATKNSTYLWQIKESPRASTKTLHIQK